MPALELGQVIDFWRRQKRNYQLAFGSPAGNDVLIDLAKFCYADRSTFDADPRVHAALEGRREVWLRIQNHLRFNSTQLAELYSGRRIMKDETDG